MLRSYDKFGEAERRLIRNWQIGFITFYGAAFLALLAIVIVNHAIDGRVTNAAQAEIPAAAPITNPTQITLNAKGSSVAEVKKSF